MRAIRISSLSAVLLFSLVGHAPAGGTGGAQEQQQRGRGAQALVELGEALFFERALSSERTTSCASCHVPEYSFADGRQLPAGQNGRQLPRNAPTLINRPPVGFQFWDGRALSLADQVVHPLENPDEMGASIEDACRRLGGLPKYTQMFAEAFGDAAITPQRLTAAIAAYAGTLLNYSSDYDRAKQAGKLAPAVGRGERLFFGRAGCAQCHTGRDFTDERFHNTGVAWRSGRNDLGRGALTGRGEDTRAFKTPTLRELTRTGPYMHDGSLRTLEDVVSFYAGGGSAADPHLDGAVRPLKLTAAERKALVAFLRSLSDSREPPFRTPEVYRQ